MFSTLSSKKVILQVARESTSFLPQMTKMLSQVYIARVLFQLPMSSLGKSPMLKLLKWGGGGGELTKDRDGERV